MNGPLEINRTLEILLRGPKIRVPWVVRSFSADLTEVAVRKHIAATKQGVEIGVAAQPTATKVDFLPGFEHTRRSLK